MTPWDPDVDETVLPIPPAEPVDLNALNDGRCKASSWRGSKPRFPTYEHHFGPGGFNRCVGPARHVNRLHKDEWGNVFTINPEDGAFRVVRREDPPGIGSMDESVAGPTPREAAAAPGAEGARRASGRA